MKVKTGKTYDLRNGKRALIMRHDRNSVWPFRGFVIESSGEIGSADSWTADGGYVYGGTEHPLDIVTTEG